MYPKCLISVLILSLSPVSLGHPLLQTTENVSMNNLSTIDGAGPLPYSAAGSRGPSVPARGQATSSSSDLRISNATEALYRKVASNAAEVSNAKKISSNERTSDTMEGSNGLRNGMTISGFPPIYAIPVWLYDDDKDSEEGAAAVGWRAGGNKWWALWGAVFAIAALVD